VVENVTGAGGQTGSKRVGGRRADGYKLPDRHGGHPAQSQSLYKKPLYNRKPISRRSA